MPNPKSGSCKRRQLRPRLKRYANNVDVANASRSLSGLSIPDASSPEPTKDASSDSQTPNPTKDASSDSQSPIPTEELWNPRSVMVNKTLVDGSKKKTTTAPPEYSAFQSVEEEAKWRAELKRNGVEGIHGLKISRVGWGTRPINSECIGTWVPPGPEAKCDICGGNHWSSVCSYWVSVPPNTPILNERDYEIVCQCGWDIVDGVCGKTYQALTTTRSRVIFRAILYTRKNQLCQATECLKLVP